MPQVSVPTEGRVAARIPDESRPGLRQRLRAATSEAHARLDSALGAYDLTALSGYRRFLEVNAAALLPLEAALTDAGVARCIPDWRIRSRRIAILTDLERVGGEARPLPVPWLPAAGVFGAMYVLEGSRLGARLLLKTVAASPDPVVAGATAFLRHGEGLQLWPRFLALLEAHASTMDDDSDVMESARRAFALFAKAAARA